MDTNKLPVSSSSTGFILARNRYGKYCIAESAAHRPTARFAIKGKVSENDTIKFMVTHLKKNGGDVISAGTFFGDFLPALSMATTPHSTVWAFEPNPESFRCAAITVLMNDLKNIKLINAALGDKSETRNLRVCNSTGIALGGGSHVIKRDRMPNVQTVPTSVVRIDDAVPDNTTVSILQLDVERFEKFALAGAVKTIKRSRPIIILETVPRPGTSVVRFLKSLNYSVTGRLNRNFLLKCG